MPYQIIFDPEENGYYVETIKTGKLHSKHKLSYEMACRQLKALYIASKKELHGGSFIPFLKSIPGRITALFSDGKRLNYRPQDRELLAKYGNQDIVKITIIRTPLANIYDKALNVISFGHFDKIKADNNYTDFYHLFIILTLANGVYIRIEKNQTIELKVVNNYATQGDHLSITPSNKYSLIQFLNNGEKLMGIHNYFTYDPKTNNCQVYIAELLIANHESNTDIEKFIMQDVSSLPAFTHAIAKAVTDLGHRADILVNGASLLKYKK